MTLHASSWGFSLQTPTLAGDEVHVWCVFLDRATPHITSLQQILSADECERAERFYFPKDREHFISARGLLRAILGGYLEVDPGRLRFCYSPYGKPALDRAWGGDTLRFNVSHSDRLALYAVTCNRELGVDVERIRPDFAGEEIAERFFSPNERAALRRLHPDVRCDAFFNCWTRKEAYIKARGEGLSLPLDQFDVSLTPGEPAALLNTRGDPADTSRWSLREIAPAPGYAAALCVEGSGWQLKCWHWPRP